jgi:hypothetical protein
MRELQHRGLLELAYDDFERPLSEPWKHKDISASELISAADKKLSFHRVSSDQIVLVGKERAPVLRIAPGAWDNFCGAARAAQILNLAPGLGAYRLIWGNETGQLKPPAVPGAELVLTTRSVLGVLILASKGVEVPPKHVEHGLATLPVDEHGQPFDWSLVTGDLIQVHYSKTKPLHAFVAVKYRGYWFYIDDDDPVSKSNFALVLEVFALELAGGIVPGPVVTVPVGTTGLQVAPATGGRRGGGGGGRGGGGGGGGTGGGGT